MRRGAPFAIAGGLAGRALPSWRSWWALLHEGKAVWLKTRRVARLRPALRTVLVAAEKAERDWRLQDALAGWEALREAEPGFGAAYLGAARALAGLARFAEALDRLAAGQARCPDDAGLPAERARILQVTGDFGEALLVSEALARRHPAEPGGPAMLARSLRGLGRFSEADAVLEAAQRRFAFHLGLALAYAETAEARGDWAETLRRAAIVRRDFSFSPLAHACLGTALKGVRRFAEADAVFASAMARFPRDGNLAVNYAAVADDRGDLDEAQRRWTAARTRFPQHPRVQAGWLQSRERAALARIEAPEAAAPPSAAPPADTAPLAAFFSRFQSLGSDCEFGFVQRHFGAEPLGLLRWAGIDLDKLVTGLERSFAGVGGPERTRLAVNPSNREYHTSDSFYGLSMHSFIAQDTATEAQTAVRLGRRLAYLRDRLLDDLGAGEKIFVFHAVEPCSAEDLRRLHGAVRRHGPGCLLVVRAARDGERAGAFTLLGEGLACGLIDRDGLMGGHRNIAFDRWLALCREASAAFAPGEALPGD